MRRTRRDRELQQEYEVSIVQVTGIDDQGGSSVKWTLEFAKLNDDILSPTKYL
ncbi:hypothetical protein TIFTF001_012944 [Ficus carica]|uniref:Bet v I/Major latex protein domain-containing protein n=1 Tax=Ficus carica TaxID=3494 RepID=A0AA88AP25_FICCA|nr:hypothetical protein TIFTF001_012944 [Ficus carica]